MIRSFLLEIEKLKILKFIFNLSNGIHRQIHVTLDILCSLNKLIRVHHLNFTIENNLVDFTWESIIIFGDIVRYLSAQSVNHMSHLQFTNCMSHWLNK